MKTQKLIIALTYFTTGILIFQSGYAQKWGGTKPNGFMTSWVVNINGGATSYFGDLSVHDLDIGAKLNKESGPAVSLILTKNIFNDAIGISGQVLSGKIKGQEGDISFTAELMEYNLHARIDFIDFFMLRKKHAFGIVGYAGVGQFLFSTKKVVVNDGTMENFKHDTGVPEFVFFFGGGMYYNVNSKFGITVDLSLRQCRNDRLDDYVKNDDFDYYSYFNIGLNYYLKTLKRIPLRNKAKLANTSFMFHSPTRPAH